MKLENISLSNNEKTSFLSNLSTMLSAGISILEAINSLLEDAKGNQKKILETIRDDLNQGQQLNTSFAKFPAVFDKVTVNIVKASEQAGTLDVTLKDLRKNLRKEIEFTDKVRAAMIYPILITVVFMAVLIMILTFVIPKIASVFSRMKVVLPLPTKIMIFSSNILIKYTLPIIIIFIVIAVGLILIYKKEKKMVLNIIFSLPFVSSLARKIDLTRFSRSLYLLLNAGLPITYALELTEEIVLKKDVAKAIVRSKELVLSGKKLSEGFKEAKTIFPSIMVKITEAGEKSGSLEQSMEDVSEYLDYEVSGTLSTMITLLEPLMLVVVGVLIGGMMLSIVAPIYGLIGQVGR